MPSPTSQNETAARQLVELEAAFAERKRQLDERAREIHCLYGVSEAARRARGVEEMFAAVLALLPQGWPRPEITSARIVFDGQVYPAQPPDPTPWGQASPILVDGGERGSIEIFLTEPPPANQNGYFPKEEELLKAIAGILGEGVSLRESQARTQHLHSVLQAIGSVNQLIAREHDARLLIRGVCERLTETRGYDAAWIALFEDNLVTGFSFAGPPAPGRALGRRLKSGVVPPCAQRALDSPGLHLLAGPRQECRDCGLALEPEGCWGLAVGLRTADGAVHGVMVLKLPRLFVENPEEQRLAKQVSQDLAVALKALKREKARQAAQKEIRRREKILAAFFDQALVGMAIITGPDQGWDRVNQRLCDMLGYTRRELASRSWVELTHPDDRDADLELFKRLAAGEINGYTLAKRFIRKDGQVVHATIAVACVRRADGAPEYFIAHVIDTTLMEKSQQAFYESQQLFTALIESFPGAIYIKDLEGRLKYANHRFRKVFRLDAGWKNTPAEEVFPPESHEPMRASDQAALDRGFDLRELEIETPRQGTKVFQLRKFLVPGAHGRTLIGAFGLDITEQKRTARKLAREREQLLSLFDGIDDVIYVADPETHELLYLNPKARTIWGEASLGKKCHQVLQGRGEPCPFCTNEIILGQGRGKTHVWEFQNELNGHWYRCADKAITWPDGRLVRFELAADITEVKKTEQALAESESRFRQTFDSASIGKVLTATDGRLMRVNEAFARMLGRGRQEIEERGMAEITHPDDVAASRECIRCLVAGETDTYRMEKRYLDKHGQAVWTDESTTLLKNERGEPLHFITHIADISLRKQAEEQLKKLNEELTRSNEELQQFAYVASHDLQEPLRMVSSYTQLLNERYGHALDDKARKYIDYAVDGAQRMQGLINDLLAFSRVTTRGGEFQAVEARTALGRAVANLQALIQETGAVVTNGDLPEGVLADPTQMMQLFQNLISNAIKFRVAGQTPLVHIDGQPGDGQWVFSVRDNGMGIDQKYADKIFVIFQRLHTRAQYPGTGIGLALCKRIVERHGGRIWFTSQPGQGSTFYFSLPIETEGNTP